MSEAATEREGNNLKHVNDFLFENEKARSKFQNFSIPDLLKRERIFIELVTSDHKLKASREGSK